MNFFLLLLLLLLLFFQVTRSLTTTPTTLHKSETRHNGGERTIYFDSDQILRIKWLERLFQGQKQNVCHCLIKRPTSFTAGFDAWCRRKFPGVLITPQMAMHQTVVTMFSWLIIEFSRQHISGWAS
ncbi:uncharacterized protein BO95DRAFT_485245 [Aspergillus brunneoviolaceus CBS 621.78]|uniref:Uncharacterized protein n=1 Tax=Aspergillus brunneoviolaceus CBS 621.78 TaxID=1450534 RepID=A0ACD1FXT4_9EURO|nr:hypothetical protein BO95DRAFT_485245 [Aspergillus brunneoviolaceus CBS 621.78]RAH41779.1 hypothetical protein BO95DRAFT_485245 [Aspergillus brunneoviolaceus CBS 621.78]